MECKNPQRQLPNAIHRLVAFENLLFGGPTDVIMGESRIRSAASRRGRECERRETWREFNKPTGMASRPRC